ncbi:MAG: hypothetical protein K2Z81_16750, partial [Cyanobacteria bacterium]|nr:hypothetical protein [Cyanobacteriota bacterium]
MKVRLHVLLLLIFIVCTGAPSFSEGAQSSSSASERTTKESAEEEISTSEKFVRFLGRFVQYNDRDTFIAARLWDLNHGKRSNDACLTFFRELGKYNSSGSEKITMADLVRVQTQVYDLAIKNNNPKIAEMFFGREVTKGEVKTGGTEVERALLGFRRKLLDSAIEQGVRSSVDAIRGKPERFSIFVAYVGSEPETLAGDEDINFISNDPDAAEKIRAGTEAHIKSVLGMGSKELDSILT